MQTDRMIAIGNLVPDANWEFIGNTVISHRGKAIPSEDEINAEIFRLQSIKDANAYSVQRPREYPPIGDQLDALYHAGVFPADMAAKIKKVKDGNPKG